MDHSGMGHEMSKMAYDKMRMDGATAAPAEHGMASREEHAAHKGAWLGLVDGDLSPKAPRRDEQIYAMPVESPDLDAAAASYGRGLSETAGSPPVLDLVHLGLGPDGHTASLVPGDPALDVTDSDVALTGVYQGRRRVTLTYPIPNRSRHIL